MESNVPLALKAKPRAQAGKGALRKVRREGFVPAILYGPETKPSTISVSNHEMKMLLQRGVSTHNPIELRIENGAVSSRRVLIRDINYDPVWGDLVHIDFYEIPKNRPIEVLIPIQTKGVPVGVADGGVMQWPIRKLLVECRPDAIPGVIEIDVTPLAKGDSLHASDLPLPAGVRLAERKNPTIVTVLMPKEEEALKKPEEVAAVAAEGAPAVGGAPAAAAPTAGAEAPAKGGEKAAAGKAAPAKAPAAGKAATAGKPAAAGKAAGEKPAKGK
ncbi:MAG: 50S ribosomal protein L25 [Nitrospirae bacterium]|nr:50S ribosomal protein L25 [Nitrospirota bacterium]